MSTNPPQKRCTHCGTANRRDAQFCSSCGKPLEDAGPDRFVGRLISQRFRIDAPIASGGMGEVYRARHIELHQNVAVKFLHRRFADDEEIAARFFNEARSACRVKHPLAVTIYDFGRLDDGTLFLVMEFVEGISLTRFIKREGALQPAVALRIATQLAEALSAAHRQGVVHRDVKPDNIMIVEAESGHHSIKVLDFGIAKMLDDENSRGLTQTGTTFGTPEYMSPEQAAGQEVDARSDIYSLGLVVYAMLAGRPPFVGQNKLGLLQRQINEAHAPITRAARYPINDDLGRLVDDLLAKDPAARPQTMDAALARLEALRTAVVAMGPPREARRPATGAGAAAQTPILSHRGRAPVQESLSFDDARPDTGGYELGDAPIPSGRSAVDAFEIGAASGDGEGPTGGFTGAFDVELHTERSMPPLRDSRTGLIVSVSVGALVVAAIIGVVFQMSRAGQTLTSQPEAGAEGSGAIVASAAAEASGSAADGSAVAAADGAGVPGAVPAGEPAPAPAVEPTPAAATPAVAPAPEAAPPPAPTPAAAAAAPAPVATPSPDAERARQALESLRRGDDAGAREVLAALVGDGPVPEQGDVAELARQLNRLDTLQRAVERHLEERACVRADEGVVNIRENISLTIAQRYYGRLDECRTATRAAARAEPSRGTSPAPARPEPAREPSGGRVRPPSEL